MKRTGGWFKESYRHYLAAKGVRTRRYNATGQGMFDFQKRIKEKIEKGQALGDVRMQQARYGIGPYAGEERARLEAFRQQAGSAKFIGEDVTPAVKIKEGVKFDTGVKFDSRGIHISRPSISGLGGVRSGEREGRRGIIIPEDEYTKPEAEMHGEQWEKRKMEELGRQWERMSPEQSRWRRVAKDIPDIVTRLRDIEYGEIFAEVQRLMMVAEEYKKREESGGYENKDEFRQAKERIKEEILVKRDELNKIKNDYERYQSIVDAAREGTPLTSMEINELNEVYRRGMKRGLIVEQYEGYEL